MQVPLKIAFRDFEPSDAVKQEIQDRAAKLEQYCPSLTTCRVAVGKMSSKHHTGNLYYISLDITVPGEEIAVVTRDDGKGAHKDFHVALRDAFHAAGRRLQDYVRRRRVRVHLKQREKPPHGRVIRLLYGDGGYGFLQTPDGRELYFHSNSVLDGFDKLSVGMEVRYAEEPGENGPQASTVQSVGRENRAALAV